MNDITKRFTDEEEMVDDDFEDYDFDDYEPRKISDELSSKKDIPPYEFIRASKLAEGETPLSRVIGHENQKKELLSVIEWFKKSKELKEKGVSIPRGVILFGQPGNGKSLLIKEIIRCSDAPVFVFQGEQMNVVEGIVETFKKLEKLATLSSYLMSLTYLSIKREE